MISDNALTLVFLTFLFSKEASEEARLDEKGWKDKKRKDEAARRERTGKKEGKDKAVRRERTKQKDPLIPVSYTHLTLPTILRV